MSTPFGAVDITFDENILVPRPWTLSQSSWATDLLGALPPGPVLELCCGAGQIGLAAVAGSTRGLVQVDSNVEACRYATRNAAAAGIETDVRCGDMQEVLGRDERFALVLADPPWVPTSDVGRFPEDPVWAIDGGADGLDVARTCVRVAANHLQDGGAMLLQVGSPEQVEQLDRTLSHGGLALQEALSFSGGTVALVVRA